jgi:hypothetical protein
LPELTDRDRAFFELLRRYRIFTPTLTASQICDGSENAMKKVIGRLRDYVASDPLGSKGVYYRLTPMGAKLIGVPEELSRPLGPQALPKAIGILGFCCGGPEQRRRYIRQEFMEDFPELVRDLLGKDYHTDFFIDHDGSQARVGQIVVDLGGDYKKLVSKCRVRLRQYLDIQHLRDIVAEGLFAFAIVVAEEEKAQAIRAALNEKPLRARATVEVVPDLQKCTFQNGGDCEDG